MDIISVAKHFYGLDIKYCNHLWFLCTLFIIYIISPILKPFLDGDRKNALYLIGIIAFFSLLNKFTWQFSILEGWHSYALLYYLLGYVALIYAPHDISKKTLFILFCLCIAFQTISNYILINQFSFINDRLNIINDMVFDGYKSVLIVVATIILILMFSMLKLKHNSIISFLSENTLALYLLHQPLRNFFSVKFPGISNLHLLYPLILIVLSSILCIIMKKNRYMKYLINL